MITEITPEALELHAKWLRNEPDGERLITAPGANLTGANMTGADLYWADLSRADLYWADLTGANLTRANLTGANMTGADLTGADLTGANLTGANLTGANLTGANLTGANLTGAKGILSIGPGGSRGGMLYAVWHPDQPMIQCGCFWGTSAEFEAAVTKTHGDNQHGQYYRAVIGWVKAWYSAYPGKGGQP